MGITITGLDALIRRLEQIQVDMVAAAAQAVEISADEMAAMAKELCPVESGDLRESITASVSCTVTGVSATVSCGTPYGAYVEHGTDKMPARPFMYPAAKACEDKIRQRVAAAVRGVL